MSVTIKDVARRARVSVATVSRVVNDKGPVLAETRARIRRTIEELGYVPHGTARSLITRQTHTIGVLLPDIYGEFFSELIRGIDATVRRSGYHLLVSSSHGDRGETGTMARTMRGRVDGLIVLSPDLGAPALRASIADALPVVLLNASPDAATPFDLINIDNYNGAVSMVRHLASLGHRKIAFIRGPAPNRDASERLRGYRDAMSAIGEGATEALEFPGNFREDAGYRAGQRLARMRGADAPTAIFAANDAMAIGCLAALREGGRSVPGDFALGGFDDIPIASFTAPPLTSVRVSIAELGAAAAERVLYAVRTGTGHKRLHLTLPTTLVTRESSGSLPLMAGRKNRSHGTNGRRKGE
jgi:LacI family transcriptional regulator, galactose operon repressor